MTVLGGEHITKGGTHKTKEEHTIKTKEEQFKQKKNK